MLARLDVLDLGNCITKTPQLVILLVMYHDLDVVNYQTTAEISIAYNAVKRSRNVGSYLRAG